MSEKRLDFYFDFTSPASYLAWNQIGALADKASAAISWKPIFLGALFKETGGQGNIAVQNKFDYTKLDVQRCADHLDIPYVFPPEFPVMALGFLRWAVSLEQRSEDPGDFIGGVFNAVWRDGRNLNDAVEAKAVVDDLGIDAEAFRANNLNPEIKDALKEATSSAAARGVFGAPTIFVGDDIFWGHDRMDFVERALN